MSALDLAGMRKSFCACRRKAVDIPDHCLHDCSPSLHYKISSRKIQCLPLPNLSRAGIVVSSLQRFFRGVAIITKPEPNGGKPSEISPDRTFRSLWGLFLPQIITGNLARKSHQSNSFLYSAYAGKKLYNTVG